VGQTRPGHVTTFEAVSTDEAVRALGELEASIAEPSIVSG
jgi:hypothetical protein